MAAEASVLAVALPDAPLLDAALLGASEETSCWNTELSVEYRPAVDVELLSVPADPRVLRTSLSVASASRLGGAGFDLVDDPLEPVAPVDVLGEDVALGVVTAV